MYIVGIVVVLIAEIGSFVRMRNAEKHIELKNLCGGDKNEPSMPNLSMCFVRRRRGV